MTLLPKHYVSMSSSQNNNYVVSSFCFTHLDLLYRYCIGLNKQEQCYIAVNLKTIINYQIAQISLSQSMLVFELALMAPGRSQLITARIKVLNKGSAIFDLSSLLPLKITGYSKEVSPRMKR